MPSPFQKRDTRKVPRIEGRSRPRKGEFSEAEKYFTLAWTEGAAGVGAQFRMRIRSFQGLMRCMLGDLEGGRAIIEEMYRQRRRLGKQTHIAVDLDNLGQIDLRLGDAQAAAMKLRESVSIWQRAGEEKKRSQLISLAVAHQLCGAYEAAERAMDAAIAGQIRRRPTSIWKLRCA